MSVWSWTLHAAVAGSRFDFAMMVLFWHVVAVLVVVTAVLAWRMVGPPPRDDATDAEPAVGSPRWMLDQRLARGEIKPGEYRAIRLLLDDRDGVSGRSQ
jgi:uncharacterized membrane protein